MESAGLIKKIDAFSATEFIIDMSSLHFEQNTEKGIFYTVITLEEMHRIMNIDTKKDNFAILRYFIILISSICHDKGTYDHSAGYDAHTDFVGFMTLDTLADWCGTTKARIIEYNSILEAEKMIYNLKSRPDYTLVTQSGGIARKFSSGTALVQWCTFCGCPGC